MTSDTIRQTVNQTILTREVTESDKLLILGEIAAQIAELVEHFKRVDKSVFGQE